MELQKYAKFRSFRIIIPAVIAMIVYGNWAFYVNRDTGHQILSTTMEGLRAFTFTIIGNLLTETMWAVTAKIKTFRIRIFSAALLTWCTMQSIAFTIHFSINSNTALKTMAPSLIISSIYVSLYVVGLSRVSKKASD